MNAANRRGFLKFAGAGRGRGRSRRHRHTSAAPGKISTADQPRELRASGRGGRVVGRLTRSSHVPCPTGGPCIPWCSAGYTEAPTTSTSAPTDPSGSPSPRHRRAGRTGRVATGYRCPDRSSRRRHGRGATGGREEGEASVARPRASLDQSSNADRFRSGDQHRGARSTRSDAARNLSVNLGPRSFQKEETKCRREHHRMPGSQKF